MKWNQFIQIKLVYTSIIDSKSVKRIFNSIKSISDKVAALNSNTPEMSNEPDIQAEYTMSHHINSIEIVKSK